MASSRDMNPSARPLTHRPSLSNSSSTGLPGRSGHARNNSHSSHSLLTNSLNPNHRVTRRKSVTGPNANLAAVRAHINGTGEKTAAVPITGRRNTFSKSGRGGLVGSLPSPPPSLPSKGMGMGDVSSAIDDANELSADDGSSSKGGKARMRRASDGQPLTKEGKKGARGELSCQHCGKGYKHSSCLTKHMWEHTPEWSLTSKLLISKHQQVQLLEAATVLVSMNDKKDGEATPPESAKDPASDVESATSPDMYSEQGDRQSSADTTPPPMAEGLGFRNKRHSSIGNYSRSYQSAPSAGSLPQSNGFGHMRSPSDGRPPSSGVNNTDQTDHELATALGHLSGSFGSNAGSSGTVMLNDAPPVPPVPAQYKEHATSFGGSYMGSFPGRQPESFTRGGGPRGSSNEDVRMGGQADSGVDDDDFDGQTRGVRSDEDDDGVFGSMEE